MKVEKKQKLEDLLIKEKVDYKRKIAEEFYGDIDDFDIS